MKDDYRSFQAALSQCVCKALSIVLGAPQQVEVGSFSFENLVKGESCELTTKGSISGECEIRYSVTLTLVKEANDWIANNATVLCAAIGEEVPKWRIPSNMTEFNCINGNPGRLKKVA